MAARQREDGVTRAGTFAAVTYAKKVVENGAHCNRLSRLSQGPCRWRHRDEVAENRHERQVVCFRGADEQAR